MELKKKLQFALAFAASAAIFFFLAFSEIPTAYKTGAIIVELVLSGMILQRILGCDGGYGLVMIRSKRGLKAMDEIAKSHPKFFSELADIGLTLSFGLLYGYALFWKGERKKFIAHAASLFAFLLFLVFVVSGSAGQAGILLIAFGLAFGIFGIGLASIVESALRIATIPGSPAGAMPVIPGVTVPLETIIALIVAAAVHEMFHGILCRKEKIKVLSSGVLLFGFIIAGAFVEPDEKELAQKAKMQSKRRVLVSGPTSNAILFVAFFIAFSAFSAFVLPATVESVTIESFAEGSPAIGVLSAGEAVREINGREIRTAYDISPAMRDVKPGQTVFLETDEGPKGVRANADGKIGVALKMNPAGGEAEFLGIKASAMSTAFLFASILMWSWMLNFALAVINILPLFITDGHRLMHFELENWLGKKGLPEKELKRRVDFISLLVGGAMVLLLLVNLLPLL